MTANRHFQHCSARPSAFVLPARTRILPFMSLCLFSLLFPSSYNYAQAAVNVSSTQTNTPSESAPGILMQALSTEQIDASVEHTQSVIKSTDKESITIELSNRDQGYKIAQHQAASLNTQLSDASPAPSNQIENADSEAKEEKPVVSAEQIGLFRIYRSNLLKLTYQHVIYPESAIDRNQQGDVIIKLIISRNGKVQKVQFGERAEFNSLNKAARNAIKNAKGSFPSAPARLHGESFEVIMPIKFRLSG